MSGDTCDVCGKVTEVVLVACSALGAFGLGYCQECAQNGSEPLGYLRLTDEQCGGDVADWVLDTLTFVDGGYVPYREIRGAGTEARHE